MMGIVYYETIFCLCINARCIVLVSKQAYKDLLQQDFSFVLFYRIS